MNKCTWTQKVSCGICFMPEQAGYIVFIGVQAVDGLGGWKDSRGFSHLSCLLCSSSQLHTLFIISSFK